MNKIKWQTPAIEGYGKIKFFPQSKFLPTNDQKYKLLFNIGSGKKKAGVNAALWRMARTLNLFKAAGIADENIELAAIVYGKAWLVALTDEKHQEIEGIPNPNMELLSQLAENKVKIYICGQSLAGHNIDTANEMNQHVEIALSALLVFPELLQKGYTLIP